MNLNYTVSSVVDQQFNWLVKLFKLLFCSVECWQCRSQHSNLGWKKKAFHGIGVIVSVTPKNTDIRFQAIKRFQKKQLVDNIVKSKGISIYLFSDKLDQFPRFKPHNQFKALVVMDSLYDKIWHSGWIFSSQSHSRPNWSGFIQ